MGLDNGTAKTSHTYFFFVVAGPGGTNPACMASTSSTPTFRYAGANYYVTLNGMVSGSTLFNRVGTNTSSVTNPLVGIALGDLVADNAGAGLIAGRTVSAIGNARAIAIPATLSMTSLTAVVNNLPGSLLAGMLVAGAGITPAQTTPTVIPATTVSGTAACSPTCGITLNQYPQTGGPSVLTISGQRTLTINPAATNSTPQADTLKVYTGYYRLIGALYSTTSTSPTGSLVAFSQVNDTFYLAAPTNDVSTNVGTASTPYALSVPCGLNVATCGGSGVPVEAFGRIVAASPALISSPQQSTSLTATNFSSGNGYGPAGYSATTPTSPGYSFRFYTDAAGSVRLSATTASTAVVEATDG